MIHYVVSGPRVWVLIETADGFDAWGWFEGDKHVHFVPLKH